MPLIGQELSGRYKILSALGAGGMGEVYRAKDLRLGREVAIKILPAHLSSNPVALARFEREAKALAALSHRNILTIHDFLNDNGLSFAVMELLGGVSLRSYLNTSKPGSKIAIDFGIAIAEGLAAAHSKGVIHRDLKPENIFIPSDGALKILDFGLARQQTIAPVEIQSNASTLDKMTEPGTVLGTLPYMSPEQIRGDAIDTRTDIFSFGCVLYEMLSGERPYRSSNSADLIAEILKTEPPPLAQTQQISPELDHILGRCLAKNPDERFQSARDLAFALKEIGGSEKKLLPAHIERTHSRAGLAFAVILTIILAGAGIVWQLRSANETKVNPLTLAVADFENRTNEAELNGLSGMLITSLEQSKKLSVLTRSRMFDILKQQGNQNVERIDESVGKEICKVAKVNALVLASIRKFGSAYSIDLKVLDPNKEDYLFTAKEEGKGQDSIPAMIDKLSQKTRAALRESTKSISAENRNISQVTTVNLDAYQHYFQGDQLISRLKFAEARTELQRAIQIDPSFALAHYRLAYAFVADGHHNEQAKLAIAKAMHYVDRAPEKERSLIRAFSIANQGNADDGIRAYQQILKMYPEEKEALWMIGDLNFHQRNYAAAASYFVKILKIDPEYEQANEHLSRAYEYLGDFPHMLEASKQWVARRPDEVAYARLGRAYNMNADFDHAVETSQIGLRLFPDSAPLIISLENAFTFNNCYEQAEATLETWLKASHSEDAKTFVHRIALWEVHLYSGKYRQALREDAIAEAIERQQGNTFDLASDLSSDALLYLIGWNDRSKCKQLLQEASAFKNDENELFTQYAVLIYLGQNEFEKALEIIEKHKEHTTYSDVKKFLFDVVAGYQNHARGDSAAAIKALMKAPPESAISYFTNYDLAQIYLEREDYGEALDTVQRIQQNYNQNLGLRAMLYPRTFYLLGKMYEKKGDNKLAVQNYEKFLELWKNADKDLLDLIDAKSRLAKAKRSF